MVRSDLRHKNDHAGGIMVVVIDCRIYLGELEGEGDIPGDRRRALL